MLRTMREPTELEKQQDARLAEIVALARQRYLEAGLSKPESAITRTAGLWTSTLKLSILLRLKNYEELIEFAIAGLAKQAGGIRVPWGGRQGKIEQMRPILVSAVVAKLAELINGRFHYHSSLSENDHPISRSLAFVTTLPLKFAL